MAKCCLLRSYPPFSIHIIVYNKVFNLLHIPYFYSMRKFSFTHSVISEKVSEGQYLRLVCSTGICKKCLLFKHTNDSVSTKTYRNSIWSVKMSCRDEIFDSLDIWYLSSILVIKGKIRWLLFHTDVINYTLS